MLVQIIKRLHPRENKIMPASAFDQIHINDQTIRGYIAFDYVGEQSVLHVLPAYDAVIIADTLQVVEGEFTGRIGTPVEAKHDAKCEYYQKPHHLYLLDCGNKQCWVPVKYCRVFNKPETFASRIKRLFGVE